MKFRQEILQNNLRKFREEKGLRQIDVVDKLGYTTIDRLSYWERGVSAPNIVNLFRLAALYEVLSHEIYENLYYKFNGGNCKVEVSESKLNDFEPRVAAT